MLAWDNFVMKWGPAFFPLKLMPTFFRPYDVYNPNSVWRGCMTLVSAFPAPAPHSALSSSAHDEGSCGGSTSSSSPPSELEGGKFCVQDVSLDYAWVDV